MNASIHRNYLFDGFTVDLARGCLMREGEELKLRPKSFKALIYLLENTGRLISKEELIGAIWPGVAVTDDSLVQCLIEIRKALGGNAQRYIKTVPRRGYIFDAQVALNGEDHDAAKERRQEGEIDKAVEDAPTIAPGHTVSTKAPSLFTGLRRNKKVFATLIFAAIVLSVVFYRFAFQGQLFSSPAEFRSLAVLPFKEIGVADDDEVLGLGMTDTLITKLSNTKEIIVRPTSAVRPYVKPDQDPIAAGREQAVDAVLDGSLQKSGEGIRLSVQLLRVKDAKLLWGETFDEKLAGIFAVEDSIAQRVVEALSLRLSRGAKQRLAKQYTRNLEAYLSYQLGNEYFDQHTRAGHTKAIEYYRTAIQKDPDFAEAHVALARIYSERYSPLPPLESQQKAASELQTALVLDSNLAEAHALIGDIKLDEQDYSSAERELTLAMNLDPTSEQVLWSYQSYLMIIGKYDEAIAVARRRIDLDPLSPNVNGSLPFTLLRAGRCDEALEGFQKVHHAYPLYIQAVNNIGVAYMCKGLYKEAAAEFEKTVPVQAAPERDSFANLAFAYAKSGRREKAQEMLRELEQESRQRYIHPAEFAMIHAGLGENDRAFDYLEKAYKDRSAPPYIRLPGDHLLDVLRNDPRWADFARRKGLAH
jgi:DNA-binding winged helix-turn-helix (wHTH) protein/TolB-like protein/lipopolysaccharide biosynthesis regulator YciM